MNISLKYHIPARKLDFVNINLSRDNKIFLDPLKIKKGTSDFHKNCYNKINYFIQNLLDLARKKEYQNLISIIDNLYERNETRLGYSLETTYGKSFGENGGRDLVKLLAKNELIKNGEVEDIFDCLIMVPNIGEDKVSDLITTIIFLDLVNYTQEQCELWNIETKNVELSKLCWDSETKNWIKLKTNLPMDGNKPIVFVPKSFTGKKFLFSYDKLYRDVIIPLYKEREKETKNSRFVVQYKNGRKHVLGNALRKEYPCTKYVILDFVRKYDSVYRLYKNKIIEGE